MIVYKDKTFEKWSEHTNGDWKGDADWVLNDNTQQELEDKIINNYPYFDFVIDADGRLIDVKPTERPPEPDPEPVISQDEYNMDFDFRLSCLELGI